MAVDRAAVVRRADEYVSQGKLDLAIVEYRALLDEQPADLGAANTLGDLYASTGETAKAIEQFTRLAESERAQGSTSRAIALYKKALKVDPRCEEALSQLAEIAVGQQLLADATLYWNRLVQHRRENNDAAGMAQALIRLASLSVAKADTKLAAARAAEPHVEAAETARLYAAAAQALAHEGRAHDALDTWLEAARRTDDLAVRRAAAHACLEGGCLERAAPFLSVEVAGDEPALLWALGERAAQADDQAEATQALGRYRSLVPDDADRVSALLAKWEVEAATAVEDAAVEDTAVEDTAVEDTAVEDTALEDTVVEEAAVVDGWHRQASDEVDLTALFDDAPAERPVPAYEQVADDGSAAAGPEVPAVEEVAIEEPANEAPSATLEALPEDADPEVDEAATIAQLQAAAETPALQFQAAAQLGRWFLQKGQFDRGVEWLERACGVPAPVREHGLAARYDLADALERAGHLDRALASWSDLEFDAAGYRDVAERLARLTRRLE